MPHGGPGHRGHRGPRRRPRTAPRCRRGERRGAGARLQRHARLLRRPRGDGGSDRRRRAGCTPATSASLDERRQPAHHRPAQGHVHRRRVQRLPGRDRAGARPASGGGRGRRRSASPTQRLGEVGRAFVVPRPGATVDRGGDHRVLPRAAGQLQGAALGAWSSPRCPATRRARCSRPNSATRRHATSREGPRSRATRRAYRRRSLGRGRWHIAHAAGYSACGDRSRQTSGDLPQPGHPVEAKGGPPLGRGFVR